MAAYEQSRATAAELTRKLAALDDYSAAVQQDLDAATAAANAAVLRRDAFREDLAARDRRAARRRGQAARRPRSPATSGSASGAGARRLRPGGRWPTSSCVSGFYAGYLNDVQDAAGPRRRATRRRASSTLTDDGRTASDRAEAARKEVAQRRAELQKARDEQAAAKAAADAEVERQQPAGRPGARPSGPTTRRSSDSLQRSRPRSATLLRARQAATAAPAAPARSRPRTPGRDQATRRPAPAAGDDGQAQAGRRRPSRPRRRRRRPHRPRVDAGGGGPPTTNNAGAGPPPAIAVQLSYPLPGYPVVSTYGWRIHPILGVRKLHEGIDIWAPARHADPRRRAPAPSIWAGPRNGYGNAVIIDHGSGVGTVYAHQSSVGGVGRAARRAGATSIGYVGQTGLAAGPHLHFEVRVGGKTYDPLAYVTPS